MSDALSYTLRPARQDDIERLAAVQLGAGAMFRAIGMDEIANTAPLPDDFLRSFVRSGLAFVAVGETDRPIGFALASPLDTGLHLYEISVEPAHGRRGVGGRLLASLCDEAKARGLQAVTLSTFRDVPWNAPFYMRHGFRSLTRADWTPGFYVLRLREEDSGLPVDRRCFMRKDLT